MILSCIKCGFFFRFADSPSKQIGYCLSLKLNDAQKEDSKRNVNISEGEEIEMAENCECYFNVLECNKFFEPDKHISRLSN